MILVIPENQRQETGSVANSTLPKEVKEAEILFLGVAHRADQRVQRGVQTGSSARRRTVISLPGTAAPFKKAAASAG